MTTSNNTSATSAFTSIGKRVLVLLAAFSVLTFTACDKEKEEEVPEISFKTGSGYVSSNSTVSAGDALLIGIEAEVKEEKDPLVKFNISKAVDGGSSSSVYNEDLNDETFEYDYSYTVDGSESGKTVVLTFTVTNRDGLTGQKSLTLAVN